MIQIPDEYLDDFTLDYVNFLSSVRGTAVWTLEEAKRLSTWYLYREEAVDLFIAWYWMYNNHVREQVAAEIRELFLNADTAGGFSPQETNAYNDGVSDAGYTVMSGVIEA